MRKFTITTQRDARRYFNEHIAPDVIRRYGKDDHVAMRCAFGDWLDSMQKSGQISERAYMNWSLK